MNAQDRLLFKNKKKINRVIFQELWEVDVLNIFFLLSPALQNDKKLRPIIIKYSDYAYFFLLK